MLDALAGFLALFGLDHLFATDFSLRSLRTLMPRSIALELVAILALFVWIKWRGAKPGRWLFLLLAGISLALALLRFLSYAVPQYFGRPFSAASDFHLVPVVLDLVQGAMSGLAFALLVAGSVAALGLLFWLMFWMLGSLWRMVERGRPGAAVAFAVVALAGWTLAVVEPEAEWTPNPVEATTARLVYDQAERAIRADALRAEYRDQIRARVGGRARSVDLDLLHGRPVLLVFIESYGAITLTDPEFRQRLASAREAFAERIRRAGYHAMSDTIRSPVIGGGSWFAHATMTSGVHIEDQLHYDALIESGVPMLADYLARAGYETVAAMPRMERPWPEGRGFGFERIYTEAGFGYAGPRYAWHSLPDQFVLDWIDRRELSDPARSRFVQYVLASSHASFDLVPPVIDRWDRLGDGSVYRETEGARFPLPKGGLFENEAGYLAAIEYDLDVLARYLADRYAGHGLVILLGDHQPPLARALGAGERSVPIHVLSRDQDLLEPFRAAGWTQGIIPARTVAADGMETFLGRFLTAYGATTDTSSTAPTQTLR